MKISTTTLVIGAGAVGLIIWAMTRDEAPAVIEGETIEFDEQVEEPPFTLGGIPTGTGHPPPQQDPSGLILGGKQN